MNNIENNSEQLTTASFSETASVAMSEETGHRTNALSNIFVANNDFNREDLSSVSLLDSIDIDDQKNKEELNRIHQLRRMARNISIPTNDQEVRMILQDLKFPESLLSETNMDRRDRLKKLIGDMILRDGVIPNIRKFNEEKSQVQNKPEENEIFYTEGSTELKNMRLEIAKFSLPRSAFRIEISKKKFMEIDRIQEGIDYEKYLNTVKNYEFVSSQFADERGCTKGSISPDGQYYGVAGISGICTILRVDDLNPVTILKGHKERVNAINFHPNFQKDIPMMGPNIATGSNDFDLKLWSFKSDLKIQKSATFKGHEDKINSVEFHPMGKLIASGSNDKTWILWDIETKKDLLLQEGHSAFITSITFQNDGALLASGDSHGIGLLWDLRSGRNILQLQGHVMQILTLKFSPNCYQIASGSDDNTIKIWDLRKKGCLYTIPAHNQPISDIQWEQSDNKFLVSCSYDGTFKIWNNRNWSMIKSYMNLNDSKLTSIAMTKDNKNILTTSVDRTVKKWSNNFTNDNFLKENEIIDELK